MKSVDSVKIRMYRQGLGDCFLLTFKDDLDENFNILIDCGVLSKATEYKNKMIEVAKNIKEVTGNTIDLLVATHEHWDHLSGFLQAKDIFNAMTIKEVWMAWTENPKDTFANQLKSNTKMKLKAIHNAFNQIKKVPTTNFNAKQQKGHQNYLNAFNSFFNFYGVDKNDSGFNLNGTSDAFDILKNHKNTIKTYLEPKSDNVIELPGLPGVRIYVLGPPKNKSALNKMNPSRQHSEVYELDYSFSFGNSFASALIADSDPDKPFDAVEELELKDAKKLYPNYFDKNEDWRKIDDDWLYSAGNLAIALDSAVNNTSLVLAFEFIDSKKVMLFPADAQIGNWLSWSNYEWTIENNGTKEKITIDDLFKRTVFYKVGHHGSHNATMKERGLEKMVSKDLIAMIPVNQKMAKAKNWKMPFPPLLEALNEKTGEKVIIQDENYPNTITKANKVTGGNNSLFFDVAIFNKP